MRTFGTRREKVKEEWRKLHVRSFIICIYSSRSIVGIVNSRRMRWDVRNLCKTIVDEPKWTRSLGRPRCKCEHKTKTDLK
jgi:hypothetical protein